MRMVVLVVVLGGMAWGQTVSQPNWYSQVQAGNQTGITRIGQVNAFFVKVFGRCEVARPIISAHLGHSAAVPGWVLRNKNGDKLYINLISDALFFRSTLFGNTGALRGWGNMRVVARGTQAPMSVTLPHQPALVGSGFYIQAYGWEWILARQMWSCQFTTLPQYVRITA